MWHVNWVYVVVPFIVILPAIWSTKLIIILQAGEVTKRYEGGAYVG